MELNKALEQVRKLIEFAEAPVHATGEEAESARREQKLARERADQIMERYAIEEWQALKAAGPKATKPQKIKVDIGEAGDPFLQNRATLAHIVAGFCRCSSVWMAGSGYKAYGSYPGRMEYAYVYGYESDLRYFELLFTVLLLHMSEVLFPKPDQSLTEGENIRNLRNAGLDWNMIADAFGWELYVRDGRNTSYKNKDTGEVKVWAKVVGRIKKLYTAEIVRRGEEPFSLGRGGAGYKNFRVNAMNGYLIRVRQRLQEIQGKRGTGAEIVLADRSQNISQMIKEDHPTMSHDKAKTVRFNQTAYLRGVQHANTANLNPEASMAPKREIGE